MSDHHLYLWAQWGILNHEHYQKVIGHFGNLKTAWEKIDRDFLCRMGFGQEKSDRVMEIRTRLDFEQMVRVMEEQNVRILCVDDPEYPLCLRSIHEPPVFLFIRGKLPPLHKAIGVVGTRKITDYGRLATETMVSELISSGFVIVSGLALGVDACAHETALKNKGVTVAVLGSGVDVIYPCGHQYLAERLLQKNGCILSEYPLGTPAAQHHFPARNRIIAGLSRGVLITEGGIRSGALITARYALDQGREVFAVPNNITKKGLSGTNHLIRRGEAKLVENAAHILEEFGMQAIQISLPLSFNPLEMELIEKIKNGGKSIDELVLETPYNVARLSEIFIHLQLRGIVREVNRKWVIV